MTSTILKTDSHVTLLQPEIELLLACSRTNLDDKANAKIKAALKQKLDWSYLIDSASRQGVLPLVYYNLNRAYPELVPADVLLNLRHYFVANSQTVLKLTAELVKIIQVLQQNQIDAITFKGPTLAAVAYGQLALREFCDLDILIEGANSRQVVDLLVSLGYQLPDPLARLEERPYMAYKEFLESEETQKKYNLFHKENKVAIDLQWSLTERRIDRFFPVDFQHLDAHADSMTLAGTKIKQFSAEDMLLYLCFHGSKHCWSELKWVCDVAEFVRANPKLDWQTVNQRAKAWKLESMYSLGLFLVQDLLEIDIPKGAKQDIKQDRNIQNLIGKVRQAIFAEPLTEAEQIAFRFKLRNKIYEQMFYSLDVLLTPTAKEWDYLPFRLPKPLSFLYRLVRLYRVSLKYLRHVIN